MGRDPLEFKHQARYIGSLKKDVQLCDFYELVSDGLVQYVYIPVGAVQEGWDL